MLVGKASVASGKQRQGAGADIPVGLRACHVVHGGGLRRPGGGGPVLGLAEHKFPSSLATMPGSIGVCCPLEL